MIYSLFPRNDDFWEQELTIYRKVSQCNCSSLSPDWQAGSDLSPPDINQIKVAMTSRELRAACNQIQSPQKCYLTRRPWDYHHKRWAGSFPALSSLSLLALHKSKFLSQHCTAKRTWHHHINTLSSVTYYVQTYFFSSIYMRLLSSFRLILLYL